MSEIPDAFEFEYEGSTLVYGRGRIDHLGDRLAEYGLDRALVVTGRNVGANPDVMGPVSAGLGDRLLGVFDETTPEKLGETAVEGVKRMRREEPDVLVGVGGGSSLDVARQMSVLAADGRSLADYRAAAREGTLEPPDPDGPLTPVVVVPTTFAGADVSSGGSIEILPPAESPTGQPVRTSGAVTPEAMVYDPDLFETTPMAALSGSAMNGFNKGVETLYSRSATPITDATAIRGLRALHDALGRLPDPEAIERAVVGIVLVQFDRRISLVHAFGHGFSRRYDLQQGVVHAVVVPHALEYLFERVDGRQALFAEAFGIDPTERPIAEGVVEEVTAVRDALGLPSRLRELEPVRREDLPAIARATHDDPCLDDAPLEPTVDELEAVLAAAW